jgi:hypothetical protein
MINPEIVSNHEKGNRNAKKDDEEHESKPAPTIAPALRAPQTGASVVTVALLVVTIAPTTQRPKVAKLRRATQLR